VRIDTNVVRVGGKENASLTRNISNSMIFPFRAGAARLNHATDAEMSWSSCKTDDEQRATDTTPLSTL